MWHISNHEIPQLYVSETIKTELFGQNRIGKNKNGYKMIFNSSKFH